MHWTHQAPNSYVAVAGAFQELGILESESSHSVEAGDRSGALIGMLRSLTIGDDAGRTSCSRTGSNNRGERRPVLYPGNPLGISNEGTDNELHQTDMLSGFLHRHWMVGTVRSLRAAADPDRRDHSAQRRGLHTRPLRS